LSVLVDKTRHPVAIEIVRRLAAEREKQRLSKYELAQRSGVSQQMIGYIERGLRVPSLDIVLRIADGLKLNLGEFMRRPRRETSRGRHAGTEVRKPPTEGDA
jgi:transcriptional regulator with XRE-family HTH domain